MEKFCSLMKGHRSPSGRVSTHSGSLQKLKGIPEVVALASIWICQLPHQG